MRIADTTLELEFVKVINGFQRPVYNKIQKKYIIMDSFSFIMFTIFIPLREIQEKKRKTDLILQQNTKKQQNIDLSKGTVDY